MKFLNQLRRYGETDRIAFRYGDQTMTFAQLDAWSDAFAAWLLKTFGDDRTPILLYGHKELCLPVCMFGAIKAGRGYVPVDTTFPAERVAQILAQVQPKVMVDLRHLGLDAPVVMDEAKLRPILKLPPRPPRRRGCGRRTWPICSSPPAPRGSPRACRSPRATSLPFWRAWRRCWRWSRTAASFSTRSPIPSMSRCVPSTMASAMA